jgi:ribosomal protein S18 acetylase RimI-like enzyme
MIKLLEIDKKNNKYIDEILKLEEEVFGKNGGVDIWLLKPLVKYGKVLVLIDEDNEIKGVAEFIKSFDSNEVYLYGIALKKSERGKGRGTLFLELIKNYMKKYNISTISLTVSPKNEVAVNLYKKCGFEEEVFLENEYGIGNNRILMKYNY